MRRIIAGSIPLIASVVIPATFQGTVYLIVLWLIMGLAGLALVLSSEPVKRPLIAALRRELEIPATSQSSGPPSSAEGAGSHTDTEQQLAISEISEEVEAAHGVLNGPQMARFFVQHELATFKWERYGPVLAASDPALHKSVRGAYRAMDALNNRGITRNVTTSQGEPTTLLDADLVQAAREGVDATLAALEPSQVA